MDPTSAARRYTTLADLSLSPQGTWNDRALSATATSILQQGTWTPGVTMYTNTQVQVIKLELPGADIRNVRIELESGMLSVSGDSKCGTFYRRIPIRYRVSPGQLRTSMCREVLEITVPNPAK